MALHHTIQISTSSFCLPPTQYKRTHWLLLKFLSNSHGNHSNLDEIDEKRKSRLIRSTCHLIESIKNPCNVLMLYHSPRELFKAFREYKTHIWKAFIQPHLEFEAGLYWHKSFVSRLPQTFTYFEQPFYNPSLLVFACKCIFLLCTKDPLFSIRKTQLYSEVAIANLFQCCDHEYLSRSFKGA